MNTYRTDVFVLTLIASALLIAFGIQTHRLGKAEALLGQANTEISATRATLKGVQQSLEAVIRQQAQLDVVCNQKIISYVDELLQTQPAITRAVWETERKTLVASK